MAWFKKKPPATAFSDETLKSRIDRFWNWFVREADHMQAVIDAGDCGELLPTVSERTKDAFPAGMGWVFGPAEEKKGHSFTLSPEGNREHQFLAQYWHSRAPDLPHWEFHSAKRPNPTAVDHHIHIGPMEFKFSELWLAADRNEQKEKLDIVAWHPLFEQLAEQQRISILFILLDELLGEYGTENWIGSIDISDEKLKQSVPVAELPGIIAELEASEGWKKYPPPETYCSYQIGDPPGGFLRGDIFVGSTTHYNLVNDYLRTKGSLSNPLAGTGADFVFTAVTSALLAKGEEVGTRCKIEDHVIETLEAAGAGTGMGGATGTEHFYSDYVLYDGQHSMDLLVKALQPFNLPAGSGIHFFAKEKTPFDLIF